MTSGKIPTFRRASVLVWVARASSTAPWGELHKRASGSSTKGAVLIHFKYIFIFRVFANFPGGNNLHISEDLLPKNGP